jgi:hypothetical protein
MTTPMESYVKLQFALFSSWTRMMALSSNACANAVEHQAQLLHKPHTARSNNLVATGADWSDHYGRRRTDIDIERV